MPLVCYIIHNFFYIPPVVVAGHGATSQTGPLVTVFLLHVQLYSWAHTIALGSDYPPQRFSHETTFLEGTG